MNVADSFGIPSADPVTDWNNRNVGIVPGAVGYDIGLPSWVNPVVVGFAYLAWHSASTRASDNGKTPSQANQAGNEALRDHYKVGHGCMDCERRPTDPRLLHFDHRDGDEKQAQPRNESDLTRAANIRWPAWRYVSEIVKCDVVCGDCHGVRTEARAQGITQDEARERIDAARRVAVLGALRADGIAVETLGV